MNKLQICRIAEHLVCAELTRIGFIATTFAHNVPVYDIIATGADCRSAPIQVKSSIRGCWRSNARKWMKIRFCRTTKTQHFEGELDLGGNSPLWICVAVGEKASSDHFYIITQKDLQQIICRNYQQMLLRNGGHKPKNWRAVDCWWSDADLHNFENNWDLVRARLGGGTTSCVGSVL